MRPGLTIGFALWLAVTSAPGAWAQSQTLADVRQELSVLFVEMQRLRIELSTTGGVNANIGGDTLLDRVNSVEIELGRLTAKTEELENRINRIVKDGTNRIGDLEFRLVELEGGDVSQLGQTSTLGGDVEGQMGPADVGVPTDGVEMAVGERIDFDQAKVTLDDGAFAAAADMFVVFSDSYPGSPLASEAQYHLGTALYGLGDTADAARAYLESFSGSPDGPVAPDALLGLGVALGRLGQLNEACISLGEVSARFPGADVVARAQQEMLILSCP